MSFLPSPNFPIFDDKLYNDDDDFLFHPTFQLKRLSDYSSKYDKQNPMQ